MDFEDAKERVKEELRSYLAQEGIATSEAFFPCPVHDDTNPSCHIIPNSNLIKCFGCGFSGDIFHIAHQKEGLPLHGSEFATVTLPRLCERFNIPYTPRELTPEDLEKHKAKRAYADAASLILKSPIDKRIEERGWTKETCIETKTGSVPSWDWFADAMKDLGYSRKYLENIDLNKRIFNEYSIIFTWCNPWGDPIGFAARDTRFEEGKRQGKIQKYVNTSNSSPTFSKANSLYGINWAKGKSPIVITEGYPDVVTAYQHGIRNIMCLGGVSLAEEHIELLMKHHVEDIVLALNADNAGKEAMVRHLDKVFAGHPGLRVTIKDLSDNTPEGIKADIDNIFKHCEDAKEKWNSIHEEDAFSWRLKMFSEDFTRDKIVDKMLPLIVNQRSNVRREEMLITLSERTGYSVEALWRDLDRLTYHEKSKVREELDSIAKDTRRFASSNDPEIIANGILEASQKVKTIQSRFTERHYTTGETLTFINQLKEELIQQKSGIRGFKTGYSGLDFTLSGIPRSGRMIGLAGEPSMGKSSFLHQLIWKILENAIGYSDAPNKDVCILLMTIDDNRQVVLPRLVSIDTGLTTSEVQNPKQLNPEDYKRWQTSWDRLSWLIKHKYLDLRDSSHGVTLEFFEEWIRYVRKNNPDRQILAILDNFHKLEGYGVDDRVKYKAASQTIHKLKTELNITFICTMELVKVHGEARPEHVAETKKLLYDLDALIHIHSDLKNNDRTNKYWMKPGCQDKLPKVMLRFWKNKIEGKESTLWYNLDPQVSQFIETDPPTTNQKAYTPSYSMK